MRKIVTLLGVIILSCSTAGRSFAGFTYAVLLDQASYSTTVGGTFSVGLTLRETYDNVGPASTFVGLSAWNLGVTRTESIGGIVSSAPSFTDALNTGVPLVTNLGLQVRNSYLDFSAPYASPTVSGGGLVRDIYLGAFNFGAVAEGNGTFTASTVTTFDVTLRDALNDGSPLDLNALGATFGTATFTITAVPEPGTMALVGLGIAAAGLGRRFRRKLQATAG